MESPSCLIERALTIRNRTRFRRTCISAKSISFNSTQSRCGSGSGAVIIGSVIIGSDCLLPTFFFCSFSPCGEPRKEAASSSEEQTKQDFPLHFPQS